jgi:hypothetical protein
MNLTWRSSASEKIQGGKLPKKAKGRWSAWSADPPSSLEHPRRLNGTVAVCFSHLKYDYLSALAAGLKVSQALTFALFVHLVFSPSRANTPVV